MIPVIASRPDGLGTRLLTILYALRFADQLGAEFSIAWPSLAHDHYDPTSSLLKEETVGEIFEVAQPIQGRDDVQIVTSDAWASKRVLCLHGSLADLNGMTVDEVRDYCSAFDVMLFDLPFPVVMAGSSEEIEAQAAKENWLSLNIAQEVRGIFERLANTNGLAEGVAAHIRRGDMIPMLRNAKPDDLQDWGITQIFQRYIPVNTVVNIVKERFPDTAALAICSEDPTIADRLRPHFPGKNVFSSGGVFPPDGNQAALLDLMILAGAKHLISPFKSYFSECASTVGRCELVNSGLDIPSLVDELISNLDDPAIEAAAARRAIVYLAGYLNLWYDPDSTYRAWLLERARAEDMGVVERMLKPAVG